jgi:hypothetical protein
MALSKIDVANMLTGATPVANGGTAATTLAGAGLQRPLSKPIIVNGDMAVAQRSTSVSSISTAGYHGVDRVRYSNSSSAVVVTISQETLSSGNAFLNGFHNAMKLDCTTADTSIASGHLTVMQYKIEAQDCTVFRKGTENAKKMTVAFWFKATKTGTYILQIGDSDNNRKISKAYTVSTTNTWEHKVLAFDIETSNAMDDDNGPGFVLTWWLAAGSDYSGGTLATSWEATEFNSNSAAGQVNAFDSTDNNVHITGIQAEVGEFSSTTLPPFQHESFGDNLARCHRYFLYTGGGSAYQHHGSGVEVTSTAAYMTTPLTVPMRASPSITANNTSGALVIYDGNSEGVVTSVGTTNYSPNTSLVNVAVTASGGGLDDGNGITVYSSSNSNAGFLFDAEL